MTMNQFPSVDPMGFLVDDEIRPFEDDQRQDVTGSGAQACETLSTGQFIVHEHVVPEDTAEIITGVFPHCWERTNPGGDPTDPSTAESVSLIDAKLLAGFVLFDRTKDNNQPYLVSHDYNRPTVATSPNNTNRDVVRGTTFLSMDAPMMTNIDMRNPLRLIYLPGGSLFRVIFQLAPVVAVEFPTGTGIPGAYEIGTGAKRIDFAGALVTGVRMPQRLYNELKEARRRGLLGPEGGARRP